MRRPRTNILLMLCVVLAWASAPKPAPAAPEQLAAPLDAAPFGLNTHLATRYPDPLTMNVPAGLIQQSGAGWAREDIHWYRVEPTPGKYD